MTCSQITHSPSSLRPLQVLLNDRLDVPPGSSGAPFKGTTQAGVEVCGDVLLVATGVQFNSSFMRHQLADALDQHGRIKAGGALPWGGVCAYLQWLKPRRWFIVHLLYCKQAASLLKSLDRR